jgi:hypothetical protein
MLSSAYPYAVLTRFASSVSLMATLFVSIVVDWEGEHFRDVGDLRAARDAIQTSLGKTVPFTHFICPTYWLQPHASLDPTAVIRSHVLKGDELALHVHCWEAIVRAADVPFVSTPDWNEDGTGHGVPLGAYGRHVAAILRCARDLVQRRLGATVHGFRCGGAMTSDAVYEALMTLGLRYDCSAFPPALVSRGFGPNARGNLRDTFGARNLIANSLVDLWGGTPNRTPECSNRLVLAAHAEPIAPTTQPFWVRSGQQRILEMPGNGGISDYASAASMRTTFDTLLERARTSPVPLFFTIGCHQEGAGRWKRPLIDFCHERRTALASDAVVVTTVAKAAKVARRSIET